MRSHGSVEGLTQPYVGYFEEMAALILRELTSFVIFCQDGIRRRLIMATMNVSLPDPMKLWVEAQAKGGKYGNASDYVRDLIRKDQERQNKIVQFQKLINDGLESGLSTRTMEELLVEARERARTSAAG
jgi:antitoxin ParD1/3/4